MVPTLLSTAELLDPLLFIVLAIKAYTNADTSIVLYTFTFSLALLFLPLAITLSLNDEPAFACGYEPLKDIGKFTRHLFERTLDCFILTLVQNLD